MTFSKSKPGGFLTIGRLVLIFTFVFFNLYCTDSEDVPAPVPIIPNNDIHELLIQTVDQKKIPGIIAAIIDTEGLRLVESAGVRKMKSEEALSTKD